MIKKHIKYYFFNLLGVYGSIWLIIEPANAFGWLNLQNLGVLFYLYHIFLSLIIAGVLTYIHFYLEEKEQKQIAEKFPQLIDFRDTFRKINWNSLIEEANSSIEIIVYYFDSWINQFEESLYKFISKPKTTIKVFVANPENQDILQNVNRLFPEYTKEIVREKIAHTNERFSQIFEKAGASKDRFEFYYYPYFLNYSLQLFDKKKLVLSIFEMYRQNKIDSPAIVIDLDKSDHIKEYVDKELTGIKNTSKKIN